MIKKRNKKGQQILGLSFSVIFSIFLMIFFIIIAFIAIKAFLDSKKCAEIGFFRDAFEKQIKKTWNSQKDSFDFKGTLPSNIDYVCFANLTNQRRGEFSDIGFELGVYKERGDSMFLYPTGKSCSMPSHNVKYLDIEDITRSQNPYCIEVKKGIVNLRIEKGFNQRLVSVSRIE